MTYGSVCFFSLKNKIPANYKNLKLNTKHTVDSDFYYLCIDKKDKSFSLERKKGIVVVANSRIDNKKELLKSNGLSSKASDAELILHMHSNGRLDFNKIYGVFSFIIYEEVTKKIYVSSDHAQLHPIFYLVKNDLVVFSNSVKLLKNIFQNYASLDNEVIKDYLVSGHPREGRTIFKNIDPIVESTVTSFSLNGIEKKKYFKFQKLEEYNLSLEESIEGVEEIFFRVLSDQLDTSNKKIGFTLSGGLDSSSILCSIDYLNKNKSLHKDLYSASATFSRIPKDQYPFADETNEIKDLLGHTSTTGKLFDFYDEGSLSIADKISKTDEPIVSPNLYLHETFYEYFRNNEIFDIFEGLGGDTTISHGTGLLLEHAKKGKYLSLFKDYGALRKTRKKATEYIDLVKRYVVLRNLPYNFQKSLFRLRDNGKQNYFNINLFLKKKNYINIPEHFEFLHGYHPYAIPKNVDPEVESHNSIFRPYSLRSGYHFAQSKGMKSYLPYMDKRLINFCINVPLTAKMSNGITRFYFREAMKKYLPNSVYQKQTKSNVGGVFDLELRKFSKSKLQESLFSNDSYFQELIDKNKINEYLARGDFSNGQVSTNLYKLYVLNIWLKENA